MLTQTAQRATQAARSSGEEQQLVLFQLAGENYGVDIYLVQRLIEVPEITRIPRAPEFIAGVIDVRGDIIPVVNLKRRFGFSDTEVNQQGRLVIVEIGDQTVAFLVDGVSEVTRLAREDIEPPSELVTSTGTQFIAGIGKQNLGEQERLIIVLSPEKVLSQQEQEQLATVLADAASPEGLESQGPLSEAQPQSSAA